MVEWLLGGDPAIRWQVMPDLLDEPAEAWGRERSLTVESGWVAELLARQGPDGEWPGSLDGLDLDAAAARCARDP